MHTYFANFSLLVGSVVVKGKRNKVVAQVFFLGSEQVPRNLKVEWVISLFRDIFSFCVETPQSKLDKMQT